jgi:glyoxylase-like metal-dependent hydrolase (beta-lactamase superfamily II)
MMLEQIRVGALDNFSYVLADEENGLAAIVDPDGDAEKILHFVRKKCLNVRYVINTHSHHDHVSGNSLIVSNTGAKVVMHARANLGKDVSVNDGDILSLGKIQIKVIYTPGHTPDSICLLADGALFTGDTLFVGECGRTDLAGGSSTDMYDSLFNKILQLDRNLRIYPGHDYGEKPQSTLGREIETNYTLTPRSREEFVRFMSQP